MAKRGRPPTVNKNAPPGKKWCPRCKKFKWTAEFNKKDNYCHVCRRAYWQSYERKDRGTPATVMYVATDITCVCGTELTITTGSSYSTGVWECTSCGNDWSGSVSVNMRSTTT